MSSLPSSSGQPTPEPLRASIAETSAPVRTQTDRLVVIDMLRGVAMLLMALDHSFIFGGTSLTVEGYGGVYPPLLIAPYMLLGFATNIASGIFFTLTGVSVSFFERSREKRGWSQAHITRFLFIRALILLALDQLVSAAAWESPPAFDVLSSLAFCLMALAFMRRQPLRLIGITALVLFLGYPLLVTWINLPLDTPLGFITTILLHYHYGPHLVVQFPALARLSLVLFGYVWGRLLITRRTSISTRLIWIALAGLGITLALRVLGGYGNFLPYQSGMSFAYFFIESKQPPSIVFLLFNESLAVILLVGLHQWQHYVPQVFKSTLTLFGQTALFFYVIHLLLYSRVISRMIPPHLLPIVGETDMLEYLLGLLMMIPLCAGYRALRQHYPNSLLQYL